MRRRAAGRLFVIIVGFLLSYGRAFSQSPPLTGLPPTWQDKLEDVKYALEAPFVGASAPGGFNVPPLMMDNQWASDYSHFLQAICDAVVNPFFGGVTNGTSVSVQPYLGSAMATHVSILTQPPLTLVSYVIDLEWACQNFERPRNGGLLVNPGAPVPGPAMIEAVALAAHEGRHARVNLLNDPLAGRECMQDLPEGDFREAMSEYLREYDSSRSEAKATFSLWHNTRSSEHWHPAPPPGKDGFVLRLETAVAYAESYIQSVEQLYRSLPSGSQVPGSAETKALDEARSMLHCLRVMAETFMKWMCL